MKPTSLIITGQTIDLPTLSDAQYTYYEELAEKINHIYTEAGEDRVIIGLSGPAGAGKSVLTAMLTHIFSEKENLFQYVNLGLDAFHYTNDELDEKELHGVKGRHDTYNIELLTEKLDAFNKGEDVLLPEYSRETHNPVSNIAQVTELKALILLEGQWLLRNTPRWEEARNLCSYQFSLTGPEESLKENVIKRHKAGGRDDEDAKTFYQDSDYKNTLEIQNNSVEADETLVFYKDI